MMENRKRAALQVVDTDLIEIVEKKAKLIDQRPASSKNNKNNNNNNKDMSWGYNKENGPCNWYKDFPIANGERQSPIDIDTKSAEYDPELSPLSVKYAVEEGMEIVNTGHSIKAGIKAKSIISGGPLTGEYTLEQFHLHWGVDSSHGSEHTIDGKSFVAELHLVHWNSSKYANFGEAASQPDGLAVFGIMLQIGEGHKAFQGFCDCCKDVQGNGAKCTMSTAFNPADLLVDLSKYWTYLGSLTTPPLLESVTWIVFKEPMGVTEEMMNCLRSLQNVENCPMVDNYRPPVAIKGRKVRASFQ